MNSYSAYAILLIVATLFVTFNSLEAKTECERKREDAERLVRSQDKRQNLNLAIVVPNCDADGNYAQLQCHHGSAFCQCWDKEGSPLSQPKKDLRKCSCVTERAKALKRIPPSQTGTAYLTECERDGAFKAKQCGPAACWCVNPETGTKLGSDSRDKSSVRC